MQVPLRCAAAWPDVGAPEPNYFAGGPSHIIRNTMDFKATERRNLLLLTRLVLRGLLEYSMRSGNRLLSAEHQQLEDMFVMVEKAFRHGLKNARNLLPLRTPDQELWQMVERVARRSREASDAVVCVKQLPNVHSPIGRLRAWMRLAVMQKKLSDYFQILVDAKDILNDFYEPWALLRNETGVVLTGSLIGLQVLDCNLCLKEDDLSLQANTVDLCLYIKIPTLPIGEEEESKVESNEESLKTILDQKNYLEDRNRQLVANLENLQRRLSLIEEMRRSTQLPSEGADEDNSLNRTTELETAMAQMETDVHEKRDTILSLRQQVEDVKKINVDLYQKHRASEDSHKHKDRLIAKLTKESETDKKTASKNAALAEAKLKDVEARLEKTEALMGTLQMELKTKTEFCADLQSELVEAKKQGSLVVESRSAERLAREELQAELDALRQWKEANAVQKSDHDALRRRVQEYERTLEEMGIHLSVSKLQVEDLKEGMGPLTEAQWESDKETSACKNCERVFNVSRRKHHCRNCGGIFCGQCSENTMPLPSSAKPVRVCDICYEHLLQRFSSRKPNSSVS